jgi:hypothetical protein
MGTVQARPCVCGEAVCDPQLESPFERALQGSFMVSLVLWCSGVPESDRLMGRSHLADAAPAAG